MVLRYFPPTNRKMKAWRSQINIRRRRRRRKKKKKKTRGGRHGFVVTLTASTISPFSMFPG